MLYKVLDCQKTKGIKEKNMIDILRKSDSIVLLDNNTNVIRTHVDVDVAFDLSNGGCSISYSSKQTQVAYILLRWNGSFDKEARFYGDTFERAYGNLEFRCLVPHRLMCWYCVATTPLSHTGYGVKTRPNCFCYWTADDGGITLWLDVRCGALGYCTGGEYLPLAELVLLQSEEKEGLFPFMKRFAGAMAEGAIFPDKPVYGSNNWYYAYGKSSEGEILEDCSLLEELTRGLDNRPYMVIDDCWQKWRLNANDCMGTMGSNSNRLFPDMKRLADGIKEKGLLPGLWLRPIKFNRAPLTCKLSLEGTRVAADASLPQVLARVAEDIAKVTGEWGYKLIKYDFSTFDIIKRFVFNNENLIFSGKWSFKNKMTTAQVIKGLYKTILDNSNNAVIIGCNCVSHLGSGYFHIHRSGDDTSGVNWERTRYYGVNTLAHRLHQHKTFYDIDADCVGITGKIDWKLNGEWLRLLASSGTPLFVSAEPSKITPAIKDDLRQAFARASLQADVCEPQGLLDNATPSHYLINGKEEYFDFFQGTGVISYNRK